MFHPHSSNILRHKGQKAACLGLNVLPPTSDSYVEIPSPMVVCFFFWLKNFFLLIGGKLLYSIALVSAIHQHELVIGFRSDALGRWLGRESGVVMNGTGVLTRKGQRTGWLSFYHRRQQGVSSLHLGIGRCQVLSGGHSDLRLQPLEQREINFCCL